MGETTSWQTVLASAAGEPAARERFARRYAPAVRAYLRRRWSGGPLQREVEDALQEVFLELFRSALGRLDTERQPSFRAYLYGITRHVAQRHERATQGRRAVDAGHALDQLPAEDPTLSAAFDREWARGLLRHALRKLADEAAGEGAEAERRVELLRLRFQDGTPIREVASAWNEDPVHLHRQFTRARRAFRRVLLRLLGFEDRTDGPEVRQEIQRLLALLRADGSM